MTNEFVWNCSGSSFFSLCLKLGKYNGQTIMSSLHNREGISICKEFNLYNSSDLYFTIRHLLLEDIELKVSSVVHNVKVVKQNSGRNTWVCAAGADTSSALTMYFFPT